LTVDSGRHFSAVPIKSLVVVVIFIEKMGFFISSSHVGMPSNEFQEGSCAALFYTDYQSVRESALRVLLGTMDGFIFQGSMVLLGVIWSLCGWWTLSKNVVRIGRQIQFYFVRKVE
jgi:hypothetical protein